MNADPDVPWTLSCGRITCGEAVFYLVDEKGQFPEIL